MSRKDKIELKREALPSDFYFQDIGMFQRFFLLILISVFSACSSSSHSDSESASKQGLHGTPLEVANAVVQTIHHLHASKGDLASFTNLFDQGGVRFSPFYHLVPSDLVITRKELENDWVLKNPPVKIWGEMDGSGDPIRLHIRDYFTKFVWNFPYHSNAKVTLINRDSDFVSQGNLINNMLRFYPLSEYRIVEYHQPGVNPDFGGLDWSSLMVVLKDLGNKQWSLVGLVHGSWTI